MAYNSGDSRIYALRGWAGGTAGTNDLFYQAASGGAWSNATDIAITDGGTTINYYPSAGARIVSDSTNLFVTVGAGETTFLRYNTGSNTWTKMTSTPFPQYYGTDLTYNSTTGKIYALAGYYRDETWEYDISGNSWRKLPRNQKFSYGRGPYNGASIESTGATSLYATNGLGIPDMRSYSVSSTNYPATGTYESEAINLFYVDENITFTVNANTPTDTTLSYSYIMSDDGIEWDSEYIPFSVTDGTGTIAPTYHKYIKIKITFGSEGVNRIATPTVYDYSLSYNSNDTKPVNPTNISGSSEESGGVPITSGYSEGYPYAHPYFVWSGATHNGSGISGYYVCFDLDANCADPEISGSYQTASYYEVNTALETGTYHLKIKARDNNGNVANSVWDAFTYIYDGVSNPVGEDPLHVTKTTEVEFDGGTLSGVDAYDNSGSGSLRLDSVSGFWNQNRLSLALGTISYGGELALGACKVAGLNELNSNHCLYTFRGNNTTTFYRYEIETDTWSAMAVAPAATYYGASLSEGPNNTLYATRGSSSTAPTNYKAFWSYDILTDTWTTLPNAPKDFTYGSSMAYDGSQYIYILPGNDDVFYRYDTQTGNWTAKTNVNFGNPNSSNGQYAYLGADSVYDERNNIYSIQGNQFPYFAKYSIAADGEYGETANTWTPLAPAPIGFYYSGSLAFDSDTNAIYAIAGNNANGNPAYNARQFFLKYDIETNTWSNLPDAPADITGDGGSILAYNGYVYFTRGSGSTNFYRFNISENSWELPKNGFFGPFIPTGNVLATNSLFPYGNGTYLATGDSDNLYIIRGSFDNTFGKYDVSTGSFTELARLPVGAYTGASLVYDSSEEMIYYAPGAIYTTRSSANNYFFKYNIATNSWSEISTVTRPSAQVGSGSSMAYDGSRYIYLTQGNGGTSWWRFDTCHEQDSCTPNWSANLNNPASTGWAQEAGARIVYKNGIMYSIRGGGNATNGRYFFSCDVQNTTLPGNCWTRSAGTDLPSGVLASTGGSLIDGNDGYLYVVVGNSTNIYYRYNISTPGWEQVSSVPAQPTTGGSGTYQSNRNWTTSGAGTNSYSDGLYSYVVGSSSGGTGFEKTGTYTSEVVDLTSVYDWANFTATYNLPDASTNFLNFETRTSSTGSLEEGHEAEWSAWTAVTNDHAIGSTHTFSIASPTNRYIQVRITFTSSDQVFSPRVDSFSVYYYQDIEAPENPTSSTAYNMAGTGKSIITNPTGDSWFNYTQPYFEWPIAEAVGGAYDSPNPGGSGIAGYYVCFGVGEDCDDAYGDGDFQTGNSFTAPLLAANSTDYTNSGKTYKLLVKAVDNAGLIDADSYQVFVYNFDNRVPTNPTGLTVTPLGYTAIDDFDFVWNGDVADPETGSQLDKLEYQCGDENIENLNNWHELDKTAVNLTLPLYEGETLVHAGAYNPSGENIFRLRAVDKAGNKSAYLEQKFYFSSTAPTPPQNLRVEPEGIVEENEFTFYWEKPASYTGDPNKLKYYYSVNTLPNAYNVVETSALSAGPGPFATQREYNRFYVVAKDETGNIDYDLYAYVDFYADTSAPGPPNTVQAFDTSNRETEEYSVAIKWGRPTTYDSGNFAGYAIFRSEDNENFEEVATTTGLAFIDVDLESQLYYYYVKSKDRTNNYSVASSVVSLTPTGKYTIPPTIVSEPKITVQAYAGDVTWSTNRVASSFVEFATSIGAIGTASGDTAGQVDSVTDHAVSMTGLSAGTKYYYRAKFIDVDGNIGTSDIATFETLPPPTISEVTISDIGLNTATISWETNTSATCTLKYGKGSYGSNVEESGSSTTHVQKLTGLESSSTYNFQIDAIDDDLNTFNSDEYTFTTLTQPIVSDFTVQNKDNVDLPSVVVNYKTSLATTTLVKFKGSNQGNYSNYLTNELTTEHTAEINGLDPAIEYEIIATGVDANGIEAASQTAKITTLTDSRPPGIISNRAVGRVVGRGKESRANLYVRIETDEISKAQVFFGKGTILTNFEQSTSEDPLNTYHLVTIPVDPGQVYSYIVKVKDEAGNETVTKPITVVVEASKENATEIVVSTFSNKFGWISKIWKRN